MSAREPELLPRVVLVVSLVLAISIPLVWVLTRPPRDAGTLPVVQVTASPMPTAAAPPEATPDDGAVGRVAGPATERAPAPATRSARIGDVDQASALVPERLRIPSLDVDAPVISVGVTGNGDMEVPKDVRDVGWYRHGPAPGEPGAAVLAGHVDSREQGRGVFFDLRRLDVGSHVVVTNSAGNVQRYEVVARRTYDKPRLPTDALFSRTGPPQLVLITCGGDFDNEAGSYRENVVVYAQPAASPEDDEKAGTK
jgi:LPXTG-site transpeptidase (sortase) family protein